MREGFGEEDGIGDISVIVCAFLYFAEGPLFLFVEDVPHGFEDLCLGLVVAVVLGVHVHHAAEHRAVGCDSDRGGHQLVALMQEGAI